MSLIGKQITNYRVAELIKSGGYGSVYRAEHLYLPGHVVAIKLLHIPHGDSERERERFLQEARLLYKLNNHPHIVTIHDTGIDIALDVPYIILDFAPGLSLRHRLEKQRDTLITPGETLKILTQVAQALDYAHQQGIIHLDLKPDNILFNEQGDALLSDFGIAAILEDVSFRLTGVRGTMRYMAPEQAKGQVSREADQYALGCVAYELYTGHKAIEGYVPIESLPRSPKYYNPALPDALERAILRALAPVRTERFPSVLDFVQALDSAAQESSSAPPTMPSFGGTIRENWLHEGEKQLAQQHPREALAIFEQILQISPALLPALTGKGKTLIALERYEEACAIFQELVQLDPNTSTHQQTLAELQARLAPPRAPQPPAPLASKAEPKEKKPGKSRYKRGNELLRAKQYTQALDAFEEALRLSAHNHMYLHGKGRALIHLERYEEALSPLREAARLQARNTAYHHVLGTTLHRMKRYEEALEAFQKAEQSAPKGASGTPAQMQGECLYELKRYADACVAFERATKHNPTHEKRLNELRALLQASKAQEVAPAPAPKPATPLAQPPASKQVPPTPAPIQKSATPPAQPPAAKKAVQPAQPPAAKQIAPAHKPAAQSAQPPAAKQVPAAPAASSRSAQALAEYNHGLDFYGKKLYDQALVAFGKATYIEPANARYQNALGDAYMRLKMYTPAAEVFQVAVQLEPEVHQYRRNQGDAFYALGHYELAWQAFKEAARLARNVAYYYRMQGECLFRLARYEEALDTFQASTLLDLNSGPDLLMQGECLCMLKRFPEALQAFEQATLMEPRNTAYRTRLEGLRSQLQPPVQQLPAQNAALKQKPAAQPPKNAPAQAVQPPTLTPTTPAQPSKTTQPVGKAASTTSKAQAPANQPKQEAHQPKTKASAQADPLDYLLDGGPEERYQRGEALCRQKSFEHALIAFDGALRLNATNINYQCGYGRSLLGLGRYQEALTVFNKVIQQKPTHSEAFYKKAESLEALGQPAAAEKAREQGQRIDALNHQQKQMRKQSTTQAKTKKNTSQPRQQEPLANQEGLLQWFKKHLFGE